MATEAITEHVVCPLLDERAAIFAATVKPEHWISGEDEDEGVSYSAAIDSAFAERGFCGFLEAWVGRCRAPRGACPKHGEQRCWNCGAPAVSNCSHAAPHQGRD